MQQQEIQEIKAELRELYRAYNRYNERFMAEITDDEIEAYFYEKMYNIGEQIAHLERELKYLSE